MRLRGASVNIARRSASQRRREHRYIHIFAGLGFHKHTHQTEFVIGDVGDFFDQRIFFRLLDLDDFQIPETDRVIIRCGLGRHCASNLYAFAVGEISRVADVGVVLDDGERL